MKKLIYILAAAAIFASCSSGSQKDPEKVLKQYFALVDDLKFEKAAELCTGDAREEMKSNSEMSDVLSPALMKEVRKNIKTEYIITSMNVQATTAVAEVTVNSSTPLGDMEDLLTVEMVLEGDKWYISDVSGADDDFDFDFDLDDLDFDIDDLDLEDLL